MKLSKSWSLFVVVLGLLTICLSPYAGEPGAIDQPLFFGGVITTCFGCFLVIRNNKKKR